MRLFFKDINNPEKNKRFYFRLYRIGKESFTAWYRRHFKVLQHAGSGGKNHLLEKGHTRWNRKGRW